MQLNLEWSNAVKYNNLIVLLYNVRYVVGNGFAS